MALGYDCSWDGCLLAAEELTAVARALLEGPSSVSAMPRGASAVARITRVLDTGGWWALAVVIALTSSGRSTCTAAVKQWIRRSRALGLAFPRRDILSASASSACLVAIPFGVGDASDLSSSTITSYPAHAQRWIRHMLIPGGADIDRAASNILAKRIRAWHPPRRPDRRAFPRSAVAATIADKRVPLVIRAAIALAWDSLSRLGPMLHAPGRTKSAPVPWGRFQFKVARVPRRTDTGILLTFQTFDKTSTRWDTRYVSTLPGHPFYNPGHVGSPRLLAQLRKQVDPHPSAHVWRLNGRDLRARDLVDAIRPHVPPGPGTLSGHCFRISGVNHLLHVLHASRDKIITLAGWKNENSLKPYLRDNGPL